MSELSQAIEEMRNMREIYDQLVEQNAQLAADVQTIKDAHILGFSYDGIIFEQGYEPQSAFGIIANRDRIIEVHDNRDTVLPAMSAADYPELEVFEMQKATNIMDFWMKFSTSIRRVILPSIYAGAARPSGILNDAINLTYLDIKNSIIGHYNPHFVNCVNLIDVVAGGRFDEGGSDVLANWSPTNALQDDETTLLTSADIDAGFTSNLEKLLYNIREHIAANLKTNVGNRTIYFSAAVKSAIQNDAETLASFPGNWTIA